MRNTCVLLANNLYVIYACDQAGKGETARVAVLGASGYTGAEVVRLAALHPGIRVTALTGEKQAGKVTRFAQNPASFVC